MIYENKDGINIIQFGTGDIEVVNGRILSDDEKLMFPCCGFAELKNPTEIGAYTNPDGINDPAVERTDLHTMFVFTDIRSVDVLLDHLNQVKERFLKNGKKVMGMQEITDEIPRGK